jgi:hypothetical protein
MPRVFKPIDTTPFLDIIGTANRAFEIDSGYVERMCHTARMVIQKRETWALRAELREAEMAAIATCTEQAPFNCDNGLSPCGTDRCRFASADLAQVRVEPGQSITGGQSRPRPQAGSSLATRADAAIPALRQRRAATASVGRVGA